MRCHSTSRRYVGGEVLLVATGDECDCRSGTNAFAWGKCNDSLLAKGGFRMENNASSHKNIESPYSRVCRSNIFPAAATHISHWYMRYAPWFTWPLTAQAVHELCWLRSRNRNFRQWTTLLHCFKLIAAYLPPIFKIHIKTTDGQTCWEREREKKSFSSYLRNRLGLTKRKYYMPCNRYKVSQFLFFFSFFPFSFISCEIFFLVVH